jgi:PHS family inorganic phosphate transporter-like MFS transporter
MVEWLRKFLPSERTRDTITAGVGFAADSYDLFVIGIVLVIMKELYGGSNSDASVVGSSSLAMAVIGQLLFGYLATRFGRVKLFIATLVLIIVGTLLSAAVFQTDSVSIFAMLAVTRCILGLGIGGEYPLAATITKEKNSGKSNHKTVLVFSMQGVGIMVAALMFLLLVSFGTAPEALFRLLLGFGAIPGLATIYWRVKMTETGAFLGVDDRKLHWADWKQNARALCGTAGTWFLFDITFYGNGMFAAAILDAQNQGMAFTDRLTRTSLFNLVVAAIGFVGYILARYTIDRFNKRTQQIVGFVVVALVFAVLGMIQRQVEGNLYIFAPIYGLTFLFSNWGPNTTTYVLPTIVFRARVRPFFHGIAAAAGKLGAVVGAAMVVPINATWGTAAVMYVSAAIAFVGALWTLWLPYNFSQFDEGDEETRGTEMSKNISNRGAAADKSVTGSAVGLLSAGDDDDDGNDEGGGAMMNLESRHREPTDDVNLDDDDDRAPLTRPAGGEAVDQV